MTSNTVFYSQLEGDIRAIYGQGLLDPLPLQIELQQTQERLTRLREAEQRELDGDSKERKKKPRQSLKTLSGDILYLVAGTTAISQPRAEATFTSVSSWGVAFLLSKRAITDCVKLDALANSFCVIPLLCLCSISVSIIIEQFSGTDSTPHRLRTFV